MFNSTLKKEALRIHEDISKSYDTSYTKMKEACEDLYSVRCRSVGLVKFIENVVNSIANTPKEFDTQLGKIGRELTKFRETEEYAAEAYEASVKAGIDILGGVACGMGVAAIAPTALMGIATTFGTASTGTAISVLSGAAAQKAAVAWLGRTFAGFAVKEGAGMAVGQTFLALAGPIGWGITAVSTGVSLISLTNKNKEFADSAVKEAKEITRAKEVLDETTEKVNFLNIKTTRLLENLDRQKHRILKYMNAEYLSLDTKEQYYLGALVNNILSLSVLLNETIE